MIFNNMNIFMTLAAVCKILSAVQLQLCEHENVILVFACLNFVF
jgi:hypothetical protein